VRLQRELGVSAPIAQVLIRRGFAEPAGARAFLAAEEEHPPSAFAGIKDAVEVILACVSARERITIHGDYDVDGVCSTAVLPSASRSATSRRSAMVRRSVRPHTVRHRRSGRRRPAERN